MAEREGFEPPIPVKVCLISSQVHSTGLCHLSVFRISSLRRVLIVPFADYGVEYGIARVLCCVHSSTKLPLCFVLLVAVRDCEIGVAGSPEEDSWLPSSAQLQRFHR